MREKTPNGHDREFFKGKYDGEIKLSENNNKSASPCNIWHIAWTYNFLLEFASGKKQKKPKGK